MGSCCAERDTLIMISITNVWSRTTMTTIINCITRISTIRLSDGQMGSTMIRSTGLWRCPSRRGKTWSPKNYGQKSCLRMTQQNIIRVKLGFRSHCHYLSLLGFSISVPINEHQTSWFSTHVAVAISSKPQSPTYLLNRSEVIRRLRENSTFLCLIPRATSDHSTQGSF